METEMVLRYVEGLKYCRICVAIFIFVVCGAAVRTFVAMGCNHTTYLMSYLSLGHAKSVTSVTNLMEGAYKLCLVGVFIAGRFYGTVKPASKAFLANLELAIQTMKKITYQQGVERSRRERVEEEIIEARLYQINCLNNRVLSLRHQAEHFRQSDEVQLFITDCDRMLHEIRMLGAEMDTFKLPMQTLNNIIEELSTITISAHHVNDVGRCPICTDDFVLGEEAIEMPCHPHHIFHSHCIRPWLQKHSACPTCRREIYVHKQM